MRRMYSLNQIIALIQQYAETQDLSLFANEYDATSTYNKGDVVIYEDKLYQAKSNIDAAEAWDATHWDETNVYDALKPYLIGKFVRIMAAPSSNTLIDEEIEQIKEGVFINGVFLGYTNPILIPAGLYAVGQYYTGLLIGKSSSSVQNTTDICVYRIAQFDKTITISKVGLSFNNNNGLFKVNEKEIPSYPANTGTFTLKCVDGVLTWVQDV